MSHVKIWTTHSLDKVFPDSRRRGSSKREISLTVAGNESEDGQIVIRSGRGLNKVSFSFSDLEGKHSRISSENIEGHWIWYTWVKDRPIHSILPSHWIRRAPGFFPDAFLESEELRIEARWSQPLWVKVNIPEGTPPDTYRGVVRIHYDGETETIPLSCRVWPFSLPAESTLRHTEWFFPDLLADYYHLEHWSETHWEWIARVAADMKDHHQDMILTNFFDLVDIELPEDGSSNDMICDFSRLDRWIKTFRAAGVEWLEGGHMAERSGGWTSSFRYRRHRAFPEESMDDKEYIPYLKTFLKAVYDHIEKQFGLEKIVQHIADEPIRQNLGSWKTLSAEVRSWLPQGIPLMDATLIEGLDEYIEMRVPQIQKIKATTRKHRDKLEKGLWSYVCLAPQGRHPNRFLVQDSARNRILFWLSYSLRLEGFLHWGYNYWGSWCSKPIETFSSPWTDSTGGSVYAHNRQPLPPGDPFIVYPGRHRICSSIRWEVLRKGFEDHKLLTLLEEAVTMAAPHDSAARRGRLLLKKIRKHEAKDSRHYQRCGRKLIRTRLEAGEILCELYAGTE